jgi:hypothetical protein
MKSLLKFITLSLIIGTTLQSCHTYVFQGVDSQIQGTWTLMPVEPGNTIQYNFDNGKLSITLNGVPLQFEDDKGNVSTDVNYRVENNLTNHSVVIDKVLIPNYPVSWQRNMFGRTRKWTVITSKSTNFFLMSEEENGLRGQYQLQLFKF